MSEAKENRGGKRETDLGREKGVWRAVMKGHTDMESGV